MKFQVQNENELVDRIWPILKDKIKGDFVCGLQGDLGAGKTALVKGLAGKARIKDKVSSPTFVILKKYGNWQHIDLYRFEKVKPSDWAEIHDWISDPEAVTFIEWPEKFPQLIPNLDCIVKITNLGGTKRKVEVI